MFIFTPVLILLYELTSPQHRVPETQDPDTKPHRVPSSYG